MKWLNYHHLYYFWTVAKEGTVTAACQRLRLAQPTVSAQIRTLEESIGHKLFRQVGRRLELTDSGRLAYRYAEEIFSLGTELTQVLDGMPAGDHRRLRVGVADVLPKMVVSRVLHPVVDGPERVHLLCYEGKPRELLAKMSIHELDLVLSDSPIPPDVNLRAHNHELGECPVSIMAMPDLAEEYRIGFPNSLDGAPLLLPTPNTTIRRRLDYWFSSKDMQPRILAEFEDNALLKMFAHRAKALFAAPAVVEDEITSLYGYEVVGRLDVTERFYAISLERRVVDAPVRAIIQGAKQSIFHTT